MNGKGIGSTQRGRASVFDVSAARFLPPALVLITVLALPGTMVRSVSAAENQCVDCHEAEQLPISLGHSFEEWRVSAHGKTGVTCDKCHGGDPTAKVAEEAHKGALATADPASRVHPTNVAETCGACHRAEFEEYSKTVHAKHVQEKKSGATCLTCHGSMAVSLPSPSELRDRCGTCHEKPVKARTALILLASAKLELHRVNRTLDQVKTRDADWYKSAVTRLHGMERTYADISLRWHSFDLDRTARESRDLLHLGNLLAEELKVRMKPK